MGFMNKQEALKMNKKILLLMFFCFFIFVIAGCSKNEALTETEKTITVACYDRGNVPETEGTYENNRMTNYINENSGVKVKFIPIPRNQAIAKLNILIATKQAPDVFMDYTRVYMTQLASEGAIMPVDEIVNNYCGYYKKYLEQHPVLRNYLTVNGKMYAFSNQRGEQAVANHVAFIRQDWLEKLGLEMPKTSGDLINVAKAFTYQDPDGNGINDTLGFALNFLNAPGLGILHYMFNSAPLWYKDNDGKLEFGFMTKRKKAVFQFEKDIYDAGTVYKEFYLDNNNLKDKQNWITGKAGIFFGSYNSKENRELISNNPKAKIEPIPPLSTEYGQGCYEQEEPPELYVMVSKYAKNIKAIAVYLDWMIEKGWHHLVFGEEGKHYNIINGIPKLINYEKNIKETSYSSGTYAILNQFNKSADMFCQMAANDEASQRFAKLEEKAVKTTLSIPIKRDIPYEPPYEITHSVLSLDIYNDIELKAMIGIDGYTPEKAMDKIRSEWKHLGGDAVTEQVNKWYKENFKDNTK